MIEKKILFNVYTTILFSNFMRVIIQEYYNIIGIIRFTTMKKNLLRYVRINTYN